MCISDTGISFSWLADLKERPKGRTINDLGGGAQAKVVKKTQRLLARGKKTQLNNPETQLQVGQLDKKKKNSTRMLSPRAPQIIIGPFLITLKYQTYVNQIILELPIDYETT